MQRIGKTQLTIDEKVYLKQGKEPLNFSEEVRLQYYRENLYFKWWIHAYDRGLVLEKAAVVITTKPNKRKIYIGLFIIFAPLLWWHYRRQPKPTPENSNEASEQES